MRRHDLKHFHDAVEGWQGFVKNRVEQQLGLPRPLAVEHFHDQITLGWEEVIKAAFLHLGVVANFFDPNGVVAGGEYEVDSTFDEAFAGFVAHIGLFAAQPKPPSACVFG